MFPLSTATHPTKQTPILDALNVLDIASGALRAITPLSLGAGDPDWSPDGTRILFNSEAGHSQFAYVVNADEPGYARSLTRSATTAAARTRALHRRAHTAAALVSGRPQDVFFGDTNACGSHPSTAVGGVPTGWPCS